MLFYLEGILLFLLVEREIKGWGANSANLEKESELCNWHTTKVLVRRKL